MNMPLVLLNRRRRGGATAFSPSTLFALAEPGVWFDPSDLTTLYQDPAGTTPVTAPGNTVGLMLDKSKGLALGAELVANGDFEDGTTGWTAQSGATLSVDTGRLKVVTTSLGQGASQVLSGLVVGKTYKISIDVTVGGADWNILLGASWAQGQGFLSGQKSTSQTYSQIFFCTNTAYNVLSLFSYGAGTTYYDNISVRELAGNHATQATLASRPTYQVDGNGKAYLAFDGVDDGMVTGTITPGVDKVQVFAGVRKLSDAVGFPVIVEFGNRAVTSVGSLGLYSTFTGGTSTCGFAVEGSSIATYIASTFAAPRSDVICLIGDLAGSGIANELFPRVNGVTPTVTINSTQNDAGTGNFGNHILYIGKRAGTTLPLNGHLFPLIVRFGPNLTTARISATESWVASKTAGAPAL